VLTFTAVYIAAIAVFLTVIVVTDDPDRDRIQATPARRSPSRAPRRSGADGKRLRLPRDGGFAAAGLPQPGDLAHRPQRRRDASPSAGCRSPSPAPSSRTGSLIESGRFYVRGVERPLANAVVERRQIGSGSIVLSPPAGWIRRRSGRGLAGRLLGRRRLW
jgi:hypothetical protein